MVTAERVIDRLLASEEPAIRLKTRVHVLNESVSNRRIRALQQEIRESSRVRRLLSGRAASGRLRGRGVYDKWRGAHWVLATLADIGYPRGDKSLQPMRDQLMERWLNHESFYEEFDANTKAGSYKRRGVPIIQGRHRRCASQQGNALFSVLTLGLEDSLARRATSRRDARPNARPKFFWDESSSAVGSTTR